MKKIEAGIKISADVSGVEEVDALNKSLDSAADKAGGAAKGGKALDDAFGGVPGKLNPVAAALQKVGGESEDMGRKSADAGDKMDGMGKKSKSAADSLLSFGKGAVAALGITAALDKVGDGMRKVLDTSQEYTAIRSRMEYAFGGTEAAGQQMEWVKNVANDLGLEVKSVSNGYAQLAAATKNINISTEDTQQVFKGVAAAAASMNLSTEETNGVLLALSQIAGKGKVSMEELRGQLGERLSPAMAIAAKSMGVTTAELEKMVESGISAEEFLPKFGAAMEEAFQGAESASAPLNRLKNQLDELMLKIADSGLNDAYKNLLNGIGQTLTWVEEKIEGLSGTLTGAFADSLQNTWDTVKTAVAEVGGAFKSLYDGINDIGTALNTISGREGDFDLMKSILDSLNIALGVLSDGFKGLGVIFEVAMGAVHKSLSNVLDLMASLTFGELSESFKQAAADMEQAADKHFAAAEQKALNFESSATAAVKKAMETEAERFARLEAEARQAYESATRAAVEASEKAKAAHEAAAAAVGTAQEETARKAAEAADKQAAAALKAAQASEKAWEDAFAKTGGAADAVEKIKQPLQNLQAEAQKTAEKVGGIGGAAQTAQRKVAEAFAKIGVDTEAVATGISKKAREAFADFQAASKAAAENGVEDAALIRAGFEQMMGKLESRQEFEAFRAQLQESGNSAKLTEEQLGRLNKAAADGASAAKTAYQGLTESIKKAADGSSLQQLAQQAKAAYESSSISAAEYDNIVAQIDARTKELEQNTAKGSETAVQSHQKAAAAAQQRETAEKGAAKAAEEHAKATESASKSVSDYGYRMSQTHGYVKLTTEELEKMNRVFSGSTMGAAAKIRIAQIKEYTEAIANANEAMDALNQASSAGVVDQAVLSRAISATNQAADKLGNTKLTQFRAAIEDARRRMQRLRQEAADTTAAMQAELDELNGNSEAVYAHNYQKQIRDLQAQLAATRDSTQQGEISKQIRLAEQIYQKQKANRAAEAAASKNQQAQSGSAGGRNDTALLGSLAKGSVNIDINALQKALKQRDQSVVNSLMTQLEDGIKRTV